MPVVKILRHGQITLPKEIRKILGVNDRPVFMGVVKPNIGLPPADFAKLAYESWLGGLDIAKDDEMQADTDKNWEDLLKKESLTAQPAASQAAASKEA